MRSGVLGVVVCVLFAGMGVSCSTEIFYETPFVEDLDAASGDVRSSDVLGLEDVGDGALEDVLVGDAVMEDADVDLQCDAIHVPLLQFYMFDADTEVEYCGPAAITVESRHGQWTQECECGGGYGDGSWCYADANIGETSLVTVFVSGYKSFQTEVSLPYECHPVTWIEVPLKKVE